MEHGIEPEAETAARADDLVVLRREGLYCPAGDFHIDPWRPVERAVI
jgi:putative mRNA 3-end processing factor